MKVNVIMTPAARTSLDSLRENIDAEIKAEMEEVGRKMITEMRVTLSEDYAQLQMQMLANELRRRGVKVPVKHRSYAARLPESKKIP